MFAAGDLVLGPSLAVKAIGAGHEAAISIDRYLRGEDLREGREQPEVETVKTPRKVTDLQPRVSMPEVAVAERIRGFDEVELGYHRRDGDPRGGAVPALRDLLRVHGVRQGLPGEGDRPRHEGHDPRDRGRRGDTRAGL